MAGNKVHFIRTFDTDAVCTIGIKRNHIRRYWFASLAVAFLAFGSAIFHATQSLWGEILDEFGMVLTLTSICYLLYGLHPLTSGIPGLIFCCFFTCCQIYMGMAYSCNKYHPFFAASYIASGAFLLSVHFTLPANSLEEVVAKLHKDRRMGSKLCQLWNISVVTSYRLGVLLTLSGYGIWHFDQRCVLQGVKHMARYPYELELVYWSHPAWHLLTAGGLCMLLISILRAHVITIAVQSLPEGKTYTDNEDLTVIGKPIPTPVLHGK